jgi:hypothetical protein
MVKDSETSHEHGLKPGEGGARQPLLVDTNPCPANGGKRLTEEKPRPRPARLFSVGPSPAVMVPAVSHDRI